ncbi:hypothetical protein M569_02504 [Genlisea aurea]|uniref:RNase H type-1 domain-containing protein n=1 Tax=Genlisea aurea TaxID=192259 RepID=S8CXQ6_9LAMI|nr:hypothetical protein M569_02504 [Genlisea aurea]
MEQHPGEPVKSPNVMDTVCFINSYLSTCVAAFAPELMPLPHSPNAADHWEAPIMGTYKLNVDSGRIGNYTVYAGIFRDDRGKCVGWFSKSISPPIDPEHGEYMAAKSGLAFARFLGLRTITLETDCLTLVSAINENLMLNLCSTSLRISRFYS